MKEMRAEGRRMEVNEEGAKESFSEALRVGGDSATPHAERRPPSPVERRSSVYGATRPILWQEDEMIGQAVPDQPYRNVQHTNPGSTRS